MRVRVGGLHFYVLLNPAVGNSLMGDDAFVRAGADADHGLFASQTQEARALKFSIPLRAASASFSGPFDGFQDMSKNLRMTHFYRVAHNGDVVTVAELELPGEPGEYEFVMALGFGGSVESAEKVAELALTEVDEAQALYVSQWKGYQLKVEDLSAESLDNGRLFRPSIAALKSMEDKTYEGAFVASPSIPGASTIPIAMG